jgi:hypothetical protein
MADSAKLALFSGQFKQILQPWRNDLDIANGFGRCPISQTLLSPGKIYTISKRVFTAGFSTTANNLARIRVIRGLKQSRFLLF